MVAASDPVGGGGVGSAVPGRSDEAVGEISEGLRAGLELVGELEALPERAEAEAVVLQVAQSGFDFPALEPRYLALIVRVGSSLRETRTREAAEFLALIGVSLDGAAERLVLVRTTESAAQVWCADSSSPFARWCGLTSSLL